MIEEWRLTHDPNYAVNLEWAATKGHPMNIPGRLPILSAGKQPAGSGKVCSEQAVSWLVSGRLDLGDETDRPPCVQPVLNALSIRVNDLLTDERRMEMWPLILRQPGTAHPEMEPVLSIRLACWLADAVRDRRPPKRAWDEAVAAARAWCDTPNETTRKRCAASAGASASAAYAVAAAYRAAYAAYNAACDYVYPARAAAVDAAYNAAGAAYAADAGDGRRLLSLLAGAQDECERLTGYVPVPVDAGRLVRLGELVGTR